MLFVIVKLPWRNRQNVTMVFSGLERINDELTRALVLEFPHLQSPQISAFSLLHYQELFLVVFDPRP